MKHNTVSLLAVAGIAYLLMRSHHSGSSVDTQFGRLEVQPDGAITLNGSVIRRITEPGWKIASVDGPTIHWQNSDGRRYFYVINAQGAIINEGAE